MSEGKASGDRAVGVLTSILHSVIIRRTHEEILSGVLPPRLDISLCCSLSPMQQLHYDKIANRACR